MPPEFVKQTLRALKHRNYRLFFTGQSISLIGTWMQQIARGWLVYTLTDSAFLLGLVGFASQIPTFVLASFAGVLADRHNKHRIIIATQALAMLEATILTILTLTKVIQVWHIIALSFFSGLINAFDMPTRQSFVIDMVEDKKDLPNAIALNSSMFNAARLIGPTIAGFLIASFGEGMCFLINAVSYIAVIAALLMMKITPHINNKTKEKVLEGLKEGIKYAYNFKPIRVLLLLIALMSLAGMPYTVIMPVFARDILKGNASTTGISSWCCWNGSDDWGTIPRIQKIGFRSGQVDCYSSQYFFTWIDLLLIFKKYLPLYFLNVLYWSRLYDADGFNKYITTNSG